MTKTGAATRNIFAPTATKPTAASSAQPGPTKKTKGRGRPPVLNDDWHKVTVVLTRKQLVFLDNLSNSIRAKSGAAVSRSEIIRALVDATDHGKIDLTGLQSEKELRENVKSMLSSKQG
jgi:hypothetical protein